MFNIFLKRILEYLTKYYRHMYRLNDGVLFYRIQHALYCDESINTYSWFNLEPGAENFLFDP